MKVDFNRLQGLFKQFWTKKRQNWVIAGSLALTATLLITTLQNPKTRQAAGLSLAEPHLDGLPVVPQNLSWGLAMDEFQLFEDELRSGDVLGVLLTKQGLAYPEIHKIVENSKGVFNISGMRVGKKLYYLTAQNSTRPEYMIYEPSPYEFVRFQLQEPFQVQVIKRDVRTEVVSASGVLETNFWQALTDNGLNDELADGMIDVLAASVDFYHQKQGDRFKVVYEQHYVEGKAVGTGRILAAQYERDGQNFYAFRYDQTADKASYFDFDGRPARKAFLKSPLKYSRISSRYSKNRMHPILGYNKPHFGTDYAAPYGTPILAVADGVVEEATRRGGNGNFVKIRHDKTYETQYLHMKGFAKGIRPGARVVQGQTIGYVGATGLATGPHVCFRFWKNGKQVDHLRLNLPSPEPIKGEDFEQFCVARGEMIKMLDAVPYRTQAEIYEQQNSQLQQKRIKP